MTELDPTSGHQIITEPFSKTRRVTGTAERRSIERTSDRTPLLNRPIHRNWEMFVIWSFAVFSFLAFFLCLYVIAAKCKGNSPF